MVLAITHLVYTLNDYNRYRLSQEWLPQEFEFLRENLQGAGGRGRRGTTGRIRGLPAGFRIAGDR